MAHFLRPKEVLSKTLPARACMKVRVDKGKKELVILPGLPEVTQEGVEWSTFPSTYTVRFEDETLPFPQPTGQFMITLGTLDPYHLLTDYF